MARSARCELTLCFALTAKQALAQPGDGKSGDISREVSGRSYGAAGEIPRSPTLNATCCPFDEAARPVRIERPFRPDESSVRGGAGGHGGGYVAGGLDSITGRCPRSSGQWPDYWHHDQRHQEDQQSKRPAHPYEINESIAARVVDDDVRLVADRRKEGG